MNNLTRGGIDPRTGREFSYYETSSGAWARRPKVEGMSAVHTHMTNKSEHARRSTGEPIRYAYANIVFAVIGCGKASWRRWRNS
jgi:N-methylhydantoinase B